MSAKIRAKIHVTMSKYDIKIRDAYMKILELEKIHKTRNSKENEIIIKRINAILREAEDEI